MSPARMFFHRFAIWSCVVAAVLLFSAAVMADDDYEAEVAADRLLQYQTMTFAEFAFEYYTTGESGRETLTLVYWQMIANQAAQMQRSMPVYIGGGLTLLSVTYDGEQGISYVGTLPAEVLEIAPEYGVEIAAGLLRSSCTKTDVSRFFVMFGGHTTYTYLNGRDGHHMLTVSVSADDCTSFLGGSA